MSQVPTTSDPIRLIDQADAIGSLLRAESKRPAVGIPAFSRIKSTYARRRVMRSAASVSLLLAPIIAWTFWQRPSSETITAEPAAKLMIEEAPVVEQQPSLQEPLDDQRDSGKGRAEKIARPKAPQPKARPDTKLGAADCSLLSRAGQFEQALSCLGERARGAGMSAELALVESARLKHHVTGDSPSALADLNEYFSRFAAGTLRREAGLLRLEILRQLGRATEARSAIVQLLREVPEQETELLLQDFDLALEIGDCRGAQGRIERLSAQGRDAEQLKNRLSGCDQSDRR